MLFYPLIFVLIVFLNFIPFFMPATWTVLSFIAANYKVSLILLVLIGTVAATCGRVILARSAHLILRQRFLSDKTRENIDSIKSHVEKHKGLTVALFLFYAFSPLPTNYIFISYGLTNLPLRYLVVPFFFGRLVSYTALVYSTHWIINRYAADLTGSMVSSYFIATQILTILAVYLFTKINWRDLFNKKKLDII